MLGVGFLFCRAFDPLSKSQTCTRRAAVLVFLRAYCSWTQAVLNAMLPALPLLSIADTSIYTALESHELNHWQCLTKHRCRTTATLKHSWNKLIFLPLQMQFCCQVLNCFSSSQAAALQDANLLIKNLHILTMKNELSWAPREISDCDADSINANLQISFAACLVTEQSRMKCASLEHCRQTKANFFSSVLNCCKVLPSEDWAVNCSTARGGGCPPSADHGCLISPIYQDMLCNPPYSSGVSLTWPAGGTYAWEMQCHRKMMIGVGKTLQCFCCWCGEYFYLLQ